MEADVTAMTVPLAITDKKLPSMSGKNYSFGNITKGQAANPTVGIPRALVVYDYAPLFIGFLNKLGVEGGNFQSDQ